MNKPIYIIDDTIINALFNICSLQRAILNKDEQGIRDALQKLKSIQNEVVNKVLLPFATKSKSVTDQIFDYFDDIIYQIESKLIIIDKEARQAFLLQTIRYCPLDELRNIIDNYNDSSDIWEKRDKYSYYFFDVIIDTLLNYASNIYRFVNDFQLQMETLINTDIFEILIRMPLPYHFARPYPNIDSDSILRPKYKTLPSTYRRAAVMELINKSGLCKNIDKTKKAAFVEAVTGGNIEASPKDTLSYKMPTTEASTAAKELLKTIGIE